MAVLSNTGIRAGASSATEAEAYTVKRSARLNDDNAAYLNRTPGTDGNKKKWTFSWWMKTTKTNDFRTVFMAFNDGNNRTQLSFDGGIGAGTAGDTLTFFSTTGGTQTSIFQTNRKFRDTSAWHHCVLIVDVDNGTTADKVQLWVDGERETFSTYNAPTGDLWVNTTNPHLIGEYGGSLTDTTNAHDGYLADIHLVDGLAKAATDFGETDADTGQWVPKEYTGSYGTNGFHLAMDPANGGTIYSQFLTDLLGGETNPHNAFDGGISAECHSWSSNGDPILTFAPSPAISYSSKVEIYLDRQNYAQINGGGYTQYAADDWHELATGSGTLTTIQTKFGANSGGHSSLSAVRVDGEILVDHSAIGYDSSGNDNHWHENNLFGHEATVANDNFKVVKYTGNGGTQTINCGFQPDFVWLKSRSNAYSHSLYDRVRGVTERMQANDPAAEGVVATGLTAFTSTGFTIGSDLGINGNGNTQIAWCWKAGGAASANNTGSINASVSANPDAGFSIVSYTGTGSAGTVAHGLGKVPKLIICKNRDDINWWATYHEDLGNEKGLYLNDTSAEVDSVFWNDTSPTSTVFSVGANDNSNKNTHAFIAYCWSEIPGHSKIGKYYGTANANYPNVSCGFTPAFVMIKEATTANYWFVYDTVRGTDPGVLWANDAGAEQTSGQNSLTITPDGFKIPGTLSGTNRSQGTFIYVAFAGSPVGDLDLLADVPGAPYDNELNGGGNYATLNPLDSGSGVTLSDGNLKAYIASSNHCAKGNFGMSSDKWYWEINITQDGNNTHGIAPTDFGNTNWCGVGDSLAYNGNNGQKYTNSNGSAYGATHVTGDIIGTAFDADNGSLTFYKNGVSQGVAFSGIDMTKTWVVCCGQGASTHTYNFGARTFAYTPPTGYKALNTYNLPDPTITKGNTGFDIKLWTGTGSSKSITGLEFNPDLVVIKRRNTAYGHVVSDAVRGFNATPWAKQLYFNSNGTEDDGDVNTISSFNSDGFTIGTDGGVNNNGDSYVSWAWDAGTANVTKSAGDLNSSVYNQSEEWSAGTTSGSAYSGSYTFETTFNGSTTGNGASAATNNGNDYQITLPSAVSIGSGVTVYVAAGQQAANLWLNDREVTMDALITTFTSSDLSGDTTLTKIGVDAGIQVVAIKVDGKLLVDDDVTPTNVPSIASTYRANPNTGFSVATFTASGTAGSDNIAHGLNTKPDFVTIKRLDSADDWYTWHSSFGNQQRDYLLLSGNNAKVTSGNDSWGDGMTSNVLGFRSQGTAAGNMVAYAWSEVSGYSKFGSYTGNGSGNSFVNGPFQWCGFTPKFIMLKQTSGTNNWIMLDTVRDPYNGGSTEQFLYPNLTNAESAYGGDVVDVLSNGWRPIHGEGGVNNTNDTYIWAAFAESPFKYANAR